MSQQLRSQRPHDSTQETADDHVRQLARVGRPSVGTIITAAIVVAALVLSARTTEFSVGALVTGAPNIADFLGRMFPPDVSELPTAIALMWETLGIAIIGTAIGLVFAIPLALLASRTVFPNRWVCQGTRTFVSVLRAVPELMWALLFVSAVGLGPLAGTLAIIVGTASGVARLFADIFEAADMRAWQAAEATGARRSQRVAWVLLPQQTPTMLSYSMLILDSNVRAASLLGLVGAGGIGMELTQKLRLFEYGQVLTIVLVVLVVIIALDQLSGWVRRKLV